MGKLLIAVTMLLVPALALAWTMPVSVTNTSAGIAAGNRATVTIGATSTDVTAGTKYFYPTGSVASVTVTLGNPANIQSVTVNGTVPLGFIAGNSSSFTVDQSSTMQSVKVVYTSAATAAKYDVTVTQPEGGLVSLAIGSSSTTIGWTGVTTGTAITVKASPNANFALSSIRVNGADVATASPYNLTVTANDAVTAVFAPILAISSFDLAAPAAATSGAATSAVANVVTNASLVYYKFTSTCGGSQTAFGTNKTFSFIPNAAGTCTVTAYVSLSADGSNPLSKSTDIPVVSGLAAANYTCTSCHTGSTPTIVNAYAASGHADASYSPTCVACHSSEAHTAGITSASIDKTTYVVKTPVTVTSHGVANVLPAGAIFCTGCHNGAYAIPHTLTGLSTTCAGCHSFSGDAHGISKAGHAPVQLASPAATACGTCHSNAPHYGGTAFMEAQYVSDASLPVSCTNCHGAAVDTTANKTILAQYTSSSHGDPLAEAWRHYDWRSSSRAACARCHAGTAFVAKLGKENDITTVYQPSDILKPGEVLNCSACHTDATTGAVRAAAEEFTINMTNAATVSYDVAGASTLCARCHSGRETGDSIKADPKADGVRGFIDSHYLPVAGTLYNKGGYEYAGESYDALGSHKSVGTDVFGTGTQGPCVACHMGLGTATHTWDATSSNACVKCHDNMTAAKLEEAKASYEAALDSLRTALEAKGIFFDSTHPCFFTAPYQAGGTNTVFTNWAGPFGVASWKDVMGAAFNYNLLVNEHGAYVHNKQYALKLIADSCDFLADGAVDGQGIPAAVIAAINSGHQ